jgi:predicted transposase YbfD/YdcC
VIDAQVKRFARFLRKRSNAPDFASVKDPRKRRGQRWSLPALLNALFIGMMALETSLRGIERLTRDLDGCRRRLGIRRRVPDSTLARMLTGLRDEAGLRRTLIGQVRGAERRKALEPVRLPINMVSIDGQTLWSGDKPIDDPACQKATYEDGRTYYRLHALHAVLVSAASQPCIDQRLVPGKTNEMGEYQSFVDQLLSAYGRSQERLELVGSDAGMTSSDNAAHVASRGVAYLMGVKENQPTLLREAERLCGWGAHKQTGYVCEAATAWERYRGKRIRRELYRSRDIEGWPGWESARQLWRVKQTTEYSDGTVTVENRYFVTNLAWGRLKAAQILAVVRAHWGVENGCHWTLDVVMKQDTRCWCTTGKALRMLSWIRLMAYNALRLLKDRYLRSPKSRVMPWEDVRRRMTKALTDARAWAAAATETSGDEAQTETL